MTTLSMPTVAESEKCQTHLQSPGKWFGRRGGMVGLLQLRAAVKEGLATSTPADSRAWPLARETPGMCDTRPTVLCACAREHVIRA